MNDSHESSTAEAASRSVQAALAVCLQQAPVPFALTKTSEHILGYANLAFCHLGSITSADALGLPIESPVGSAAGLKETLDRAFRTGLNSVDQHFGCTDGTGEWLCSVWPVLDNQGKTESLGIEFRRESQSETELNLQRRVAERMLLGALRERQLAEDAEESRRRATFVAEAGRLLSQSVDHANTLLALTKLALPAANAWCIVDVCQEGGGISRLGIFHPDPEKAQLAESLERTWFPHRDDAFGAPAIQRIRQTISIVSDVDVALAAAAHSPENFQILRKLGIGALLTVPLVAGRRMLGAITFVRLVPGVRFSAEDIQLAEDLAARGALALDNAESHALALALQKNAEKANRAKSNFLGAMSHELRTPLNSIGGYVELIDLGLRGPVTPEQHADLARVRANQQHLTALVTEILSFARMSNPIVSYVVADIDACDAIQHAVDMVEPLFAQRQLTFDGVFGGKEIVARADPERVTQVLVNLLSNAIKYTPAKGHISAACGAADGMVTVTVRDTGIGIPADKVESVFEPFVQMKEGFANREGGVGLGLAISRDLARAMNGDLTVKSVEGKGSEFTLTLPKA